MKTISAQLKFLLGLARVQALTARRFDSKLGGGLSFSDFQVLYYLSRAPEEKMRRIDLAEQMALTASGITRMLLPMEKIGLVSREASSHDARVSYVKLSPGGKRLLSERMSDAELVAAELIPAGEEVRAADLDGLFRMFSTGRFVI